MVRYYNRLPHWVTSVEDWHDTSGDYSLNQHDNQGHFFSVIHYWIGYRLGTDLSYYHALNGQGGQGHHYKLTRHINETHCKKSNDRVYKGNIMSVTLLKKISLEVSRAHSAKLQRSKPHSATIASLLMSTVDRSSYKYKDKIKQCSHRESVC